MSDKDLVSVLTPRCPRCKRQTAMKVPLEAFDRYQNGALLQEAFPDFSPDDRELLLTGYHRECWNQEFLVVRPNDDD